MLSDCQYRQQTDTVADSLTDSLTVTDSLTARAQAGRTSRGTIGAFPEPLLGVRSRCAVGSATPRSVLGVEGDPAPARRHLENLGST